MIKLTIALIATLCLISGCTNSELFEKRGELVELGIADLTVALADATAHGDQPAINCWTMLLSVAERLQKVGPPVGAFSTYQKARNVRRFFDDDAVNIACAPMVEESRDAVRQKLLRF